MVGNYCREYRLSKGATLKELGGIEQVQNLSAFECGRSSNIAHLITYVQFAAMFCEEQEFLIGLAETINQVNKG